jgi:SAM-dependent methyltransferase
MHSDPHMKTNLDEATVAGFGDEWARFDQSAADSGETQAQFEQYFSLFPWNSLPPDPVGFDAGCGSGRWAKLVAKRVKALHCVDASVEALDVARRNCATETNCVFHHASVESLPFADGSMDFGYSLGVLHHVPDTAAGLRACVAKLKPGAPFLLYLYYALDNRPAWFRAVWRGSDVLRRTISRLPFPLRYGVSQFLAGTVYYPLARGAAALEALGVDVRQIPLSAYRHWTFYSMRTDALDRFGTRLEQRFTRKEIRDMMASAGLSGISFRDSAPYWCAIGFKQATSP